MQNIRKTNYVTDIIDSFFKMDIIILETRHILENNKKSKRRKCAG